MIKVSNDAMSFPEWHNGVINTIQKRVIVTWLIVAAGALLLVAGAVYSANVAAIVFLSLLAVLVAGYTIITLSTGMEELQLLAETLCCYMPGIDDYDLPRPTLATIADLRVFVYPPAWTYLNPARADE